MLEYDPVTFSQIQPVTDLSKKSARSMFTMELYIIVSYLLYKTRSSLKSDQTITCNHT